MQPLPPSRPKEPLSLWIGVLLVSRWESTTNHPLLFLVVTWQRYRELSACFQTPLPLQKLGLDLTISLTLCMPRELLYIGMLEKAWRKENSLKPVKIWLLWRKITRRSV